MLRSCCPIAEEADSRQMFPEYRFDVEAHLSAPRLRFLPGFQTYIDQFVDIGGFPIDFSKDEEYWKKFYAEVNSITKSI